MTLMKKVHTKFNKYFYYKKSVQSPKEDILFFKKTYTRFLKKPLESSGRIFVEPFMWVTTG